MMSDGLRPKTLELEACFASAIENRKHETQIQSNLMVKCNVSATANYVLC